MNTNILFLASNNDTTYGMIVQIKKVKNEIKLTFNLILIFQSPFHEDADATILKKCMAIMGSEFQYANLLGIKNAVESRIKG